MYTMALLFASLLWLIVGLIVGGTISTRTADAQLRAGTLHCAAWTVKGKDHDWTLQCHAR